MFGALGLSRVDTSLPVVSGANRTSPSVVTPPGAKAVFESTAPYLTPLSSSSLV